MPREASIAQQPLLWPAGAQGLIFDLDGTLLNTTPLHWAAWRQTAAEHGISTTKEDVLALRGKPPRAIMRTLCERAGLQASEAELAAAVSRKQDLFVAAASSETQPIEAVVAIAKAAKAQGLPVAVATGGTRRQAEASMAAAGVTHLFDSAHVVTCDDVESEKPHPGPFLEAARRIGVPPEYCVGYEDSPLGMEAIVAAKFLEAIDVTTWDGYPEI